MEFYNVNKGTRAFLEECRRFVEEYYYGHRAATAGEIQIKTVSEHFKCKRIRYVVTWKKVDSLKSGIRSQRESGLRIEMTDPLLGGKMMKWIICKDCVHYETDANRDNWMLSVSIMYF